MLFGKKKALARWRVLFDSLDRELSGYIRPIGESELIVNKRAA